MAITRLAANCCFPSTTGSSTTPGFDVFPPLVIYRADTMDATRYADVAKELERRLVTLFTTEPIRYRPQNGGDYDIPSLTLARDRAFGEP